MKLLRTLNLYLTRVETVLLVVFLAVMVVLAFAQVVLRNFFDTAFYWGDVVVRHMVLWAGFMGAAVAVTEDRHISIDALTKFLPPRGKHVVRAVTCLFAAAVCALLTNSSLVFLADERAGGGEVMMGVPSWIGLTILPIGYGLLAIHFLVRTVESSVSASGRSGEAGG